MMNLDRVYAHIIHEADGKMLARRTLPHAPAIGDQFRLSETRYVETTLVVWCLDEEHPMGQRVNIGVKDVK